MWSTHSSLVLEGFSELHEEGIGVYWAWSRQTESVTDKHDVCYKYRLQIISWQTWWEIYIQTIGIYQPYNWYLSNTWNNTYSSDQSRVICQLLVKSNLTITLFRLKKFVYLVLKKLLSSASLIKSQWTAKGSNLSMHTKIISRGITLTV